MDNPRDLLETPESEGWDTAPSRTKEESLCEQGQTDQELLLLTAQEMHRLYDRVTRWHAAGRPEEAPLTPTEVRLLQERGTGGPVCGRSLPPYIAETYRAFCLWYYRVVYQGEQPDQE